MTAVTQNPRTPAPAVEARLAPAAQAELEQTLTDAAHDYVYETTFVSREQEITESTSVLRGLALATFVSVPLWGLLIWGGISLVSAIQ